MKKVASLILICTLLFGFSGCGLIPKRVEFGQDKVEKFPEQSSYEKELQRKVADMAKRRAQDTLKAAVETNSSPAVVRPADDTAKLTDAVSVSLGPPLKPVPPDTTAAEASQQLVRAVAELSQRVDEFKKDNNENAGKKIEGTGWLSVPYFVWLGGFAALAFVGLLIMGVLWTIFKMYAASNPPVQLGVNAVQMGANFVKKALGEVVSGGEKFKNAVASKVTDPALAAQVMALFNEHQERAQSADVQNLVKMMTAKS